MPPLYSTRPYHPSTERLVTERDLSVSPPCQHVVKTQRTVKTQGRETTKGKVDAHARTHSFGSTGFGGKPSEPLNISAASSSSATKRWPPPPRINTRSSRGASSSTAPSSNQSSRGSSPSPVSDPYLPKDFAKSLRSHSGSFPESTSLNSLSRSRRHSGSGASLQPLSANSLFGFTPVRKELEEESLTSTKAKMVAFVEKLFGNNEEVLNELNRLILSSGESVLKEVVKAFATVKKQIDKTEVQVSKIFSHLRDDPKRLQEFTSFINCSPKAEIHCHLSGAMWPEDCIQLAINNNSYFDPITHEFHQEKQEGFILASEIKGKIAEEAVRALSMSHVDSSIVKHNDFFEVCRINETVTNFSEIDEMLVRYLSSAAEQTILYTEIMVDFKRLGEPLIYSEEYKKKFYGTSSEGSPKDLIHGSGSPARLGMLSPDSSPSPIHQPIAASAASFLTAEGSFSQLMLPPSAVSPNFGNSPNHHQCSDQKQEERWLEALKWLKEVPVQDGKSWIDSYVDAWKEKLKQINATVDARLGAIVAARNQTKPVFNYLVEIMRDTDVDKDYVFFATLACAMALVQSGGEDITQFAEIVGINLVGPEHVVTSRVNFSKQLKMLKFLKEIYNCPRISLHAGEYGHLAAHLVDSIEVADRIGHATSIAKSEYAKKLLKDNDIPVEVCVTSNEKTMGIQANAHPVGLLKTLGISFIIAADDPGIFLTTLTDECMKVVKEQELSYKEYKNALRNSLHYSFIDGKTSDSIFVKSKVDNQLHLRPLFWGVHLKDWEPFGPGVEIVKRSNKVKLQILMEQKMSDLERACDNKL